MRKNNNTIRYGMAMVGAVVLATITALTPSASAAGAELGRATEAPTAAAAGSATTSTTWRQVSAGESHTCAVTKAGAVKCWGWNAFGQLGDGTVTDRKTPVQVVGLESGVRGVSAGNRFTCALTTAGAVKCWGDNRDGTLGTGSSAEQTPVPVQVPGLESGAQWVSAGWNDACAVASNGALKCWGWNIAGEVGDGSTDIRRTPVQVRGLASGVVQVSAGYLNTCAVLSSGAAKCWGANDLGQLGDGTSQERHTPVAVKTLTSGVVRIEAGDSHTCAVLATGAAKCWGYNDGGAVGDGSEQTIRYLPTQVKHAESGITGISAGSEHSCLTTLDGRARCFGWGGFGQLGYGGRAMRNAPITAKGLSSVMSVSAGGGHTCAITSVGALTCWGHNYYGQLGDGTWQDRLTPVDVRG